MTGRNPTVFQGAVLRIDLPVRVRGREGTYVLRAWSHCSRSLPRGAVWLRPSTDPSASLERVSFDDVEVAC